MRYYDWDETNSHTEVRLFVVIGARTIGKTYGARKSDVRDFLKHRWQFGQVIRRADALPQFERNFFGKLRANREFPDSEFKIESHIAYIKNAHVKSSRWRVMGYFAALSNEGEAKQLLTCDNVKNITLDEAVIDRKRHPGKRYLPDEHTTFLGLCNTMLRETPDNPKRPRIRLIGNACDLTCPHFEAAGIKTVPHYGKQYFKNGRVMLDYVPPVNADEFRQNTTIGQLLADDAESGIFFDNEFRVCDDAFVMKRPDTSRLWCVMRLGYDYALYLDIEHGLLHVTRKIPKNTGNTALFALTRDEATIDYMVLRKSSDLVKRLKKMSDANLIRYDTPQTMGNFSHVLDFLGI